MKKWFIVIILACAQFIMVLDSTVMNVSIAQVVKDLHTTVSGLQAAITFYTLTMAAFMLTGGKMGDIWGRVRAFRIGSIVYALGSLLTALSPSLAVLLLGWSFVEGLGAVLVIPAIAALIAAHYSGKDRIVGYTLIGAASGIAVAVGPLLGGFMTTYLSWRYVFAGETVIMAAILLLSRHLKEKTKSREPGRIDIQSVVLSVFGLGLLVFGILQSKTWGWIIPKAAPSIGSSQITPLGISIVAYLIMAGVYLLWVFVRRQRRLEAAGANPLLRISVMTIRPLRSGLAVLSSQYFITAAVFFIIPIYLQLVLGLDALATGKKIFPLSVSIVLFSALGSRLTNRFSPKQIVRLGQMALVFGTAFILWAISPDLMGIRFAVGLLILGAGLGLLASQIGNVTMSSVGTESSSEVGGLQGTFQNFGSSLGTALIGSVMIARLTSGFSDTINQSALPPPIKSAVQAKQQAGLPLVSADTVSSTALSQGASPSEAAELSNAYLQSELKGLRSSLFAVAALGLLSILLSRNIPAKKLV